MIKTSDLQTSYYLLSSDLIKILKLKLRPPQTLLLQPLLVFCEWFKRYEPGGPSGRCLTERDIGVCGVAVLLSFLCGIPVIKIPHCGVAVISNPTVCDVCAFKSTVFGEAKLFAVLRHQQYHYSLHADHPLWTVYMTL